MIKYNDSQIKVFQKGSHREQTVRSHSAKMDVKGSCLVNKHNFQMSFVNIESMTRKDQSQLRRRASMETDIEALNL